MSVKLGVSLWLRQDISGQRVDLRQRKRMWQEAEEDCMMRSFRT
jgi:hypothetical protein